MPGVHKHMFAFERKHSLQVPFTHNEIFQNQEVIQLHTSQWSRNIELSSPLKMTRSNKNFFTHALSYVWMKLSIQYKYSHS